MSVSTRPATSLHPAVHPGGRPFTAEDLWRLPRVGSPAPAPDGTWAVVPVTTYDLEKNEGRTRLWMVSATGAFEPRPLTAPDVSSTSPRVSPDGARVAFVRRRDKTEKPQLMVLPLDGGEAERMTEMPLGVCDPRWLPDGRRIVFVSPLLRGHLTVEATKKRLEEREKDPVKAHVTEDRIYRYWDTWLDTGEVPHLFVIDLESRELRDLIPTSTRWFDLMEPEGGYDVSPDGAEVAYFACASEPPYRFARWAIYTVPVAGGEAVCLTPDHPADDTRPRYSPDGRSIVYGMQVDPFFYADRTRLVRYDRATKTHTVLTEAWDRSPAAWEFDGPSHVVFEAEDAARQNLYRLAIGGAAGAAGAAVAGAAGATPELLHRGGHVGGLQIASGRMFFTRQHLNQPGEIWIATGDATDARAITSFTAPALEGVALGEVQEMEFAGARGDSVQMFVLLPPGFDPAKKWPLVHVIHGGPHAMSGDYFHPRWNPHLFGAPGYVVALVNFHGSTSWGQEFAQCIQGLWGEHPMQDIEAATDALLATAFVDEKRMAITGGSYGGYLVSWIGSHTDRYACIVNHAGVYNTQAQYASDVTQGRHKAFGGEPWDGLEKIDRWNPARFAAGANTPTLVIHGENDHRVPVDQGLECYNVLQGKGIAARLVYFPDENHWVLKPRNSMFWYREIHDWLARFLARA